MSAKFKRNLDICITAALDGTASELVDAINATVADMLTDSPIYIVPLLSAIHVIDYENRNHLMTIQENVPVIRSLTLPAKHYLAFALKVANLTGSARATFPNQN